MTDAAEKPQRPGLSQPSASVSCCQVAPREGKLEKGGGAGWAEPSDGILLKSINKEFISD